MDSKELFDYLFKQYKSIILSRKEVALILGKSTATLDRQRKKGYGPAFNKGSVTNSTIEYNLLDVVDYIIKNKVDIT